MSKRQFIQDLKQSCREHGIRLILHPAKHIIHDGDIYGGWFDDKKKELACAYRHKSKNQLELLVHESCHLDQHILQTKIWRGANRKDKNGKTSWEKWGDWLDGKDFTKREVLSFLQKIQLVEMECEQMSVRKIRKYDLDIDINRYRAKANSYILFYTLMAETRKWIDNKAPYKYPSILKHMRRDQIITDFRMGDEMKELYKSKIYKRPSVKPSANK